MYVLIVAEVNIIPPIIVIKSFPRTTTLEPENVGVFNSLATTLFQNPPKYVCAKVCAGAAKCTVISLYHTFFETTYMQQSLQS
jgi:hypothetical protein